MEEKKIEVKILISDRHSFLAGYKCEVCAKLQEETLQSLHNGSFQIALAVNILESQKIQQVGIAEHKLRRQSVGLLQPFQILANRRFRESGDRCAFEQHAANAFS